MWTNLRALALICFILPILLIKIDSFPEIKNIISWNYFALIQLYFLFSFLSLKKN